MLLCPRCGEMSPANVAVCDCGAPLAVPTSEDAVPLDELERQALAARLPEEEERAREPSDLTLERFVFASLLGACIAAAEFPLGLRLFDSLRVENAVLVAVAAFFAPPFVIRAAARRFSGRVRGGLRFVALASFLGAVGWGLTMWLLVQAMSGLRFG